MCRVANAEFDWIKPERLAPLQITGTATKGSGRSGNGGPDVFRTMPSRPRKHTARLLPSTLRDGANTGPDKLLGDAGKTGYKATDHALGWGAGVVERGGLENRCARKCTVGSNPTPTAMGEDQLWESRTSINTIY